MKNHSLRKIIMPIFLLASFGLLYWASPAGGYFGDSVQASNRAFEAPASSLDVAPPALPAGAAAAQITCDGDGVTGKRVQVLYVHPPQTDHYTPYLASFQQWAKEMDDIFYLSALETGGTRHIRFVHDATCVAQVANVTVSAAAMNASSPEQMWVEIADQGYDRLDRVYLIFAETSAYPIGVSTFWDDDRPTADNLSNTGPGYTALPAAVWSGSNAAHELMHALGAVNSSAPNALAGGHCSDEYDRMCYGATTIVCSDPAHEQRFDCNHDDYFHTNPAPGSYLASHWNAANSSFLIGAAPFIKTWTGAVSAGWEVDGNWSPEGVPVEGYDCLIPAGTPNDPVLVGINGYCYGNLAIQPNATLTVGAGGTLWASTVTVSGTMNVLADSYVDVDTSLWVKPSAIVSVSSDDLGMRINEGGTLTVDGELTLNENFPLAGVANPANLQVNPGGRLSINPGGGLTLDGALTNLGELWQALNVPANATTTFLNITDDSGTVVKYAGVEITLGAGSGMGITEVLIQGNTLCPNALYTLGAAVRRCYTIDPALARPASVRFYYRTAEANLNPAPQAFRFNGAGWDGLTSTRGGSGEAMYVEAAGVSSYTGAGGSPSPFALKDPAVITRFTFFPLLRR